MWTVKLPETEMASHRYARLLVTTVLLLVLVHGTFQQTSSTSTRQILAELGRSRKIGGLAGLRKKFGEEKNLPDGHTGRSPPGGGGEEEYYADGGDVSNLTKRDNATYFASNTPGGGEPVRHDSKDEDNEDNEEDHEGFPRYGDVNAEQAQNRDNDKMRQLYAYRRSEEERERAPYAYPGTECDFERSCPWTWRNGTDGFMIVAPASTRGVVQDGNEEPTTDANDDEEGHFLAVKPRSGAEDLHVTSPQFSPTSENCRMQLWIYQRLMSGSEIRIIAETINKDQWLVSDISGDDTRRWIKYDKIVGKISQDFHIILEVVPGKPSAKGALVGLDNVRLLECFPESDTYNACTPYQYRCSQTNVCINSTRVCDIVHDCKYGDDEYQNCDRIPFGARCNFEKDWCGWYNVESKALRWVRHSGSTPTNRTGPSADHTFGNLTGTYAFVNMASATKEMGFASTATLNSVVFNPPPKVHGNESSRYYNSCTIRFYLHQYGTQKSGMMLQVTEMRPKENVTTEILWSYNDYGDKWVRKIVILPNITHRYFLHFDARKGIRYMGDIAIDDFSMSPECFGLNIPASELDSYSYWNPDFENSSSRRAHKDFANQTHYEFSTCNMTGRYGPVQENCTKSYSNTSTRVRVLHAPGLNGIQKWTAPSDDYYTIIALGASGGKGSGGMGTSRGAMVRTVVELRKGQEIYVLVGQEGSSACLKMLGQRREQSKSSCKSLRYHDSRNLTGVRGILNMEVADGGGGGGGGSFVFVYNRSRQAVPLVVAAGGGGLGLGRFIDTQSQHGQAINMSRQPVGGQMYGVMSAGAGGGWNALSWQMAMDRMGLMGMPLTQGSMGGQACYNSTDGRGDGGFGGGGGGCTAGGGGGGWAGGNAWSTNTTNGEGGYSYLDPNASAAPSLSEARSGYHVGHGVVMIIPAVPGCGCNFRCLALDVRMSKVACICPRDWKLDIDGKSCIIPDTGDSYPDWLLFVVIFMMISILIAFGCLCLTLYNRYQHRTIGILRRKMMSGPDLQLNRLRIASEYNPNYEFAGSICSVNDLKGIPRNQLQLQKALGQGAFGEVYQGFYRQRSGDTVEMPVAVKTLPATSTQENEVDFLMEALIMSQFNHPNIVHFIGVCFDKHPRFIVLELLAGGDLKNFLRESRPKPDKNSSLTMGDLVTIAIDVAKGCEYLESHRFIHRDIAARNCLLTTKGPGRVVKIADFGMSRDIYRSDYYKKGGRAMLPIKWMPPEAFLDGIFTTKTDIWSFGVLLWEIMSMGYMPYTGCANRQVMELVTSGGRLEPPTNCPGPIYAIMTQCWHPEPTRRPSFSLILERLGYCVQDPEIMCSPLPVFTRPPSQEREQTLMRPGNIDEGCIEISKVADYLVPNGTTSLGPLGSTSSVDRLLPENSDSWETSFVIPQSKSTQPLIVPDSDSNEPDKTPYPVTTPKASSTLRAGISLDAGALAKSVSPSKSSYMNVNPPGGTDATTEGASALSTTTAASSKPTSNGLLQNGPCSLVKDSIHLSAPGQA